MRAKQSSTALGKYSHFGSLTTPTFTESGETSYCGEAAGGCQLSSCPTAIQGEGMLHDARNLLGAIGLYCDLLAMPGVLKAEHSQYPEELRHLGARSGALIEALMRSLLTREQSKEACPGARVTTVLGESVSEQRGMKRMEPQAAASAMKPVSLRKVVERCSGLLQRVANGRTLVVELGPAADSTVRVSEEDVERILVNLVRNAVAAIEQSGTGDGSAGTIRITLGMLASRVGGARPWPFQRVRLSVEDSGCGMSASQVETVLNGGRQASGSSHGIGFRVVRELAAASDGIVQVISAVGSGTRVQIEWPVAAMSVRDLTNESVGGRTRTPLLPSHNNPQAQMEASC